MADDKKSRSGSWREAAEKVSTRAAGCRGERWFYNGYSGVFAAGSMHDDFWTDERLEDGHSYDSRNGQTCPSCGKRETTDSSGRKVRLWDCEYAEFAVEEGESVVADVPPSFGDTATGANKANAEHIEVWDPATATAAADLLRKVAEFYDSGAGGEAAEQMYVAADDLAIKITKNI